MPDDACYVALRSSSSEGYDASLVFGGLPSRQNQWALSAALCRVPRYERLAVSLVGAVFPFLLH